MQKVVVVDYGMGNLRSVQRALAHVARDAQVAISSDPNAVRAADRVVFPGQGAMPDCMRYLRETGLEEAVREAATTKPFFGICVGMQMLFDRSEEGDTPGLGILKGDVIRFNPPAGSLLKVPHMGWRAVHQLQKHRMWYGVQDHCDFYFAHSYYDEGEWGVGLSFYPERFNSAVAKDNIFAVQFHPEKSQMPGLRLYQNFLGWSP